MPLKDDFAQQNVPLRDDFFRLFSRPFSWPVQKVRFGPLNFNRGLRLHGDMTETKSPILQFSTKISIFSPIKIWSKWSLKIAPKRSVLRKKWIKATLKYTDWRAFCTYWLWWGCWGRARNLAAKIVKICIFWKFWKNEKWLTLNRKIYVTKVQKSKIWDDSFLAFSIAFVVVYFVFSVGAVFTEIFADQNRHFWKFPKKTKNGHFRAAIFGP